MSTMNQQTLTNKCQKEKRRHRPKQACTYALAICTSTRLNTNNFNQAKIFSQNVMTENKRMTVFKTSRKGYVIYGDKMRKNRKKK